MHSNFVVMIFFSVIKHPFFKQKNYTLKKKSLRNKLRIENVLEYE